MLKYLIIMLDDTSVSYCHYSNQKNKRCLISTEHLQAGIRFAMKENLSVLFVYPDYELPQVYQKLVNEIDHSNIVPYGSSIEADTVVLEDWENLSLPDACNPQAAYILRTSKKELFENYGLLGEFIQKVIRLNVVLSDVETFSEDDFLHYKEVLEELSKELEKIYQMGKSPQLNILTDRLVLEKMNNCNAGDENITLAPNGKFYVCPAFYQTEKGSAIGDLANGLEWKNPQLYKLNHAPLCRKCDAYQCKRCTFLNRKTTLEVNTPSHEQCVASHLERNASRALLAAVRQYGEFLKGHEIKEISYLDPFDVRKKI